MVAAASAAAQKLGYSALKAKQMDVVMGIVSESDVFTTLITRYGKVCVMVACPTLTTLHLRRGAFSYSLSPGRGIASLQRRHNGDSVAIAAHV